MKSIVENIKDDGESKCTPANCQRFEDVGGIKRESYSWSVDHVYLHVNSSLHKSHHCQADWDIANENDRKSLD